MVVVCQRLKEVFGLFQYQLVHKCTMQCPMGLYIYEAAIYSQKVFNIYSQEESSTKDMAHKRRNEDRVGQSVSFTKEMNLTVSKELFLNNSSNKQHFIQFLADHLTEIGCHVSHARFDADTLIVQNLLNQLMSPKQC